MTREELIDFGEMFLEVNKDSKDSNTYEFIDAAVKLFKQEPCENKIIDEHYKKGFANGIRTAECRYNNAIAEIREHADRLKDSLYGDGLRHALEIIDKYRAESEGVE